MESKSNLARSVDIVDKMSELSWDIRQPKDIILHSGDGGNKCKTLSFILFISQGALGYKLMGSSWKFSRRPVLQMFLLYTSSSATAWIVTAVVH